MDIKIGEYVRTRDCKNLPSLIGKVISIDNDMLHLDCFEPSQVILADDIIKHSKNIIDLIETGDFVNRNFIDYIDEDDGELILKYNWNEEYNVLDMKIKNDEIISVLTKEQYNQNCYKVEE